MIKKLVLFVAALTFAILIAEGMARLIWTNPYKGAGGDRFVELRMHYTGKTNHNNRALIAPKEPEVVFRTNARGYIEPAARFDVPDCTIAFLGGSTTECLVVKESLRFPHRFSELMENNDIKINVLNIGHSGNTSHDSLNILLNHVAQDAPNYAVMMHAINDVGLLTKFHSYKDRMGLELVMYNVGRWILSGISRCSYLGGLLRKNIHTIAYNYSMNLGTAESRTEDRLAKKPTVNPSPFRTRVNLFVDVCRAFGIEPILMTQPIAANLKNELTPAWVDQTSQGVFNQVIRDVGAEKKVLIIDLSLRVAKKFHTDEGARQIFYDGIHVTDFGSEQYARIIAEDLGPKLIAKKTDKGFL